MTKDEALKLALAVLKAKDICGSSIREAKEKAIAAAEEALAQPKEQKPSEYVQRVIDALYENSDPVSVEAAELLERMAQPEQEPVAAEREALKLAFGYITQSGFQTGTHEVITAIKVALEQPEQEPVATLHDDGYWTAKPTDAGRAFNSRMSYAGARLDVYTTPPQRTWVGLTDEERHACTQSPFTAENYRAIEAKLKEKNA